MLPFSGLPFHCTEPHSVTFFVHSIQLFLLSIGSLRFDNGNVNYNATNQLFDWLNEEK